MFLTGTAHSYLLYFLIFFLPFLCHGAFNNASDPGWCIVLNNSPNCVRDEGGRVCFRPPESSPVTSNLCNGGDWNSRDYQAVLDTHLKQGLSIAYYTNDTNQLLGGTNFTVPANQEVKLCLSGRPSMGGGEYRTLCTRVVSDNNMGINTNISICFVALGQNIVSDGCYIGSTTNSSSSPSLTSLPSATVTSPLSASSPLSTSSGVSSNSNAPPIGLWVGLGIGIPAIGLGFILGMNRHKITNNVGRNMRLKNVKGGKGGDGGLGESGGKGGGGGSVYVPLLDED